MDKFLQGLKAYMMPIAMGLGLVFHHEVAIFSNIIPYLIFLMLLFTFVHISWQKIKFLKMHLWMLAFQIIISAMLYYLLKPFNVILAQGAMVCILAPTATSAPVITKILGGNIENLTSYSLLCNLALVLVAPVYFSIFGFHELPFVESAFQISQKVGFLLIFPIVISYFIKRFSPKTTLFLQKKSDISFYLWSISLIIVSGKTLNYILSQSESHWFVVFLLALSSLFICIFQFWLGRKIGKYFGNTVAGGQGLGQKNTILAIWMAQMYLNPVASIAPGMYVLWQNMVNSWQVWKIRKN